MAASDISDLAPRAGRRAERPAPDAAPGSEGPASRASCTERTRRVGSPARPPGRSPTMATAASRRRSDIPTSPRRSPLREKVPSEVTSSVPPVTSSLSDIAPSSIQIAPAGSLPRPLSRARREVNHFPQRPLQRHRRSAGVPIFRAEPKLGQELGLLGRLVARLAARQRRQRTAGQHPAEQYMPAHRLSRHVRAGHPRPRTVEHILELHPGTRRHVGHPCNPSQLAEMRLARSRSLPESAGSSA